MTIISKHHPNLAQDANNDDTSHLGGCPMNHYPTDDDRPVGTTTNKTTNANFTNGTSHLGGRPTNHHPTNDGRPFGTTNNVNFADGTTRLGGRPTNHHPIDDGRLVITTNVNPTNLTTTPPTNNGTTNIAPNYASLLTLLATNPTDPTIAAAFIEFLQQKHNNNPNIIAFHICPHDKLQTLNEIISRDPLTNPQSLLHTVTEWFTNPSTPRIKNNREYPTKEK